MIKEARLLRIAILVLFIASIVVTVSCSDTTGSGYIPAFWVSGYSEWFKVKKNGGEWSSSIDIQPNDELEFRIHFHNSIIGSLAKDTRVKAIIPSNTIIGDNKSVGYIGCKNADPSIIYDDLTLRSNNVLALDYIEGSTAMEKRWGTEEYFRYILPDGIITESDDWPISIGNIRGAETNLFDGYVYFRVQVLEPFE